jgi:hypothetical protein
MVNYTFFVKLRGNIIKVLFTKEIDSPSYERMIDHIVELKVRYKPEYGKELLGRFQQFVNKMVLIIRNRT